MEQNPTLHPWFAVKVRAHSEKQVVYIPPNKRFEDVLPFYSAKRQRSDRTIGIRLPLAISFAELDSTAR